MKWRKSLSSFSAAAFQNGTTVFRCHARAKSVLLRTSAIIWLISSLRHKNVIPSLESENAEFT